MICGLLIVFIVLWASPVPVYLQVIMTVLMVIELSLEIRGFARSAKRAGNLKTDNKGGSFH